MKYLIVNSDDFGISEGVSQGILEAHRTGIVTSTTTMINMPYAESAIKQAQDSVPNLGIGLHLTLSFGQPVSPPETIPSLVTDDGQFVSTYEAVMTKMANFTRDDLTRELNAQFERFRAIAGCLPTHLDSHHGVTYFHAEAFDIMLQLAQTHNLPIRWAKDVPQGDKKPLYQNLRTSLAKHGTPRKTDHFADFIFGFASHPRAEHLKTGLRNIKEGYTELMVHVGYSKNLQEAYTFQREEELIATIDASVKQVIIDEGIQLVNFSDLPQ